MPTDSPSPAEEPPRTPLLAQAGSLFGAATLAALLGSVPAAVRVARDGGGVLRAWIGLAACALPALTVVVGFARSAREGARSILADDEAPLVTWAIAIWAMTSFLGLAAYGALLRAKTHHHGLAGVTFALGGLAIGGALALVARRLMHMARDADPFGRAALVISVVASLLCALLTVVVRVASVGDGALPSSTLIDAIAFVIAAGALSRQSFVRVASLAVGGIPLALGVLALGWALLSQEPALVEAIRVHAPLLARIAALMAGFAAAG